MGDLAGQTCAQTTVEAPVDDKGTPLCGDSHTAKSRFTLLWLNAIATWNPQDIAVLDIGVTPENEQ